ncbi:MAG: SPASM domain-containing protein [SAR324 cluster bacterium]|nr:SPASM domain-containing protein [SAR324 cluster bacterium]
MTSLVSESATTAASITEKVSLRFVQVQTHSRCNADCVFCPYVESWHADHPGKMPDWLWQKILEDLKPFHRGINRGKFLPYLMQEPLIDPSIFKKIRDVYAIFPKTRMEPSTNGMALTPKVIDQLIEIFGNPLNKHQLWVSHHGINAETFQHIMKIDYRKAHANLIRLLQASNGRLKIRIRGAGVSRDQKHCFFSHQQYHDYWKSNFEIHQINPQNITIDAFNFHDRAGTLYRTDRDSAKLNANQVRNIDRDHPFYCPRINLWIHILWDGRIRLCCMDYHGEVKLPSLQSMSLTEYFQSESFGNLYETITGTRHSSPNFICKRCSSPGG